MPRIGRTEAERFWEKVDKSGDCWLWQAGCFNNGYGQFHTKRNGKWGPMSAHRWAFIDAGGTIAKHMQLHHTCNNPRCVNPDHLVPVTAQENIAAITERTPRTPVTYSRRIRTGDASHTISFYIPTHLEERLRAAADHLQTSISFILCAALTQFLIQHIPLTKEAPDDRAA